MVEIGKSKNLPIQPKISQFPIPLLKSNFQSPKNIQPERYCAGSANYYYLDNNGIFKFVNGWIIQDKIPTLQNYWIGW